MARAARFHGVGDIRLSDEPEPVPRPGQSLVEVLAVGLCGSDLHWFSDGGIGDARLTRPLVGGHELSGVVRGGELDGRLVAIDPAIPCLHCDMCARGHRNLCRNIVFAGHSNRDGGLQQLLAWPDAQLHELPDGLDAVDGAMLEPLGVAIHAADLGHLPLAGTAAVIGCGPIGLCLIQVLRAAGADHIVAGDPLAHRRDAAARLGADVVLDPADPDHHDQLRAATHGLGVDVAFELAGNDTAIADAIEVVRPGGRVVLGGIPTEDTSSFPASTARRKGLSLVMVRRMKEVYPRAIALTRSGRVELGSLVSARYSLEQVAEAFEVAVRRTGLKIVVVPNGAPDRP